MLLLAAAWKYNGFVLFSLTTQREYKYLSHCLENVSHLRRSHFRYTAILVVLEELNPGPKVLSCSNLFAPPAERF